MRGTVLKLRSNNFDGSSDEDCKEEYHDSKPSHDEQVTPRKSLNASSMESPTEERDKNALMSNLELRRTSEASEADVLTANNKHLPFQRQVFDWDSKSMWKAMSRHPLFSKYMELQSQLNSLFEEIRLDCKKAACEKAFASLLKETDDSPIEAVPIILPKQTTETIPKKKGRPLKLKKKPGRPRKEDSNTNTSSAEWSSVAATQSTRLRKCREELFMARKPSWNCQNCARRFSSSGWLDRHKSVCSFSNRVTSDTTDQIEDAAEESKADISLGLPDDSQTSMSDNNGSYFTPSIFATSAPMSPNRPSQILIKQEVPDTTPLRPVRHSPLKPKMENHNGAEEDEGLRKSVLGEERSDAEISAVCGKCKQVFSAHNQLKRHLEEYPECKVHASPHGSGRDAGESSSDSSVSACKHCGKTFRKEKFLKRHQSLCHVKSKKKLWQCSVCFRAFRRQSHYELHRSSCIIMGPRKEPQRCENCSLLFPTQKKLLKHQAICCPDSNNHMVKLLKCLKCDVVLPSYKKQLRHRAICCPDSDTRAMVCQYCFKVLIMKDRMAAHKKKCQKVAGTLNNS